jgi:hypothetical protein
MDKTMNTSPRNRLAGSEIMRLAAAAINAPTAKDGTNAAPLFTAKRPYAYDPMQKNAAWAMESRPQNPTRMLRPLAMIQ